VVNSYFLTCGLDK